VDVVTGTCEFAWAGIDPHTQEPMTAVPSNVTETSRFVIYLFRETDPETCASFNFRAQSSQQTSTVLPPILTLKEFLSSLQSQAAQVVSTMMLLSPYPKSGQESSKPRAKRMPLSESLAICRK
jgi:hypothetical protein